MSVISHCIPRMFNLWDVVNWMNIKDSLAQLFGTYLKCYIRIISFSKFVNRTFPTILLLVSTDFVIFSCSSHCEVMQCVAQIVDCPMIAQRSILKLQTSFQLRLLISPSINCHNLFYANVHMVCSQSLNITVMVCRFEICFEDCCGSGWRVNVTLPYFFSDG